MLPSRVARINERDLPSIKYESVDSYDVREVPGWWMKQGKRVIMSVEVEVHTCGGPIEESGLRMQGGIPSSEFGIE